MRLSFCYWETDGKNLAIHYCFSVIYGFLNNAVKILAKYIAY